MIILYIYSPVCSVSVRLVYLLLHGVPVCLLCLVWPCLDSLKTVILSYILVCVFLVHPRCVHRDTYLLKIIFPMLQKQHSSILDTLPSYGTC